MPFICYDHSLRFHKSARETLDWANGVIEEYKRKGFSLTLRQLYYQAVARKHVPENNLKQYKRLGDIISRGRIAGLIDWNAISDMTRSLRESGYDTDKAYIPFLKRQAEHFTIDWWSDQPKRPYFLIEKDALLGTIDGVCNDYQVPYASNRGYSSQSMTWRMGRQLRREKEMGLEPIIFHLGDHDPSGIDMTRDVEERLWMFGGHVEIERIALNMDQIKQFDPPANFAKALDARTPKYIKKFRTSDCWELDALDPQVIADLVEKCILSVLDMEKFEARKAENIVQTQEIVDLVATLEPRELDPYEWIDPWEPMK